MKNEKISKFVLFLNQKTNYTFFVFMKELKNELLKKYQD